jgi:diguanylate cyclase (GGDEF)-like protein
MRSWLAVLGIFDAVMLRADAFSGPAAFHVGMVMRLEINLPLAVIVFLALPYVPDRARALVFGAFNLVLLTTICIQSHYALPAYAAHHMIGAGLVIGSYNLLIQDRLRRSVQFTVVATVLFVALMVAPIGPGQTAQWDLLALILVVAAATLRVRYTAEIAAREAFLLRLQDGMNTQDVLFANRVLVDLSNTDPLTRVANRRCFDERLAAHWRSDGARKQTLGLLMVDVDFFKCYNDHYGHPAGDLCLRTVAQAMAHELRHGQDMVARYGGEEFAILLPGLTLTEVEHVGTRLCRRIEALGLPHAGRLDALGCVTVSAGAITSIEAGASPEMLIKAADRALYEAKRAGRNRLCSGAGLSPHEAVDTPPLHTDRVAALSQAATLAEDLRSAMLGGHLHLHYQPIHDTRSGDVAAVEALLRWTHPQRGSIAPGAFIPAAEESGMIVPVGKWVLRAACAEAASWAVPALLAVNVSPVQFSDPGIVGTVAAILAETGLAPERLLLEITEGLQLVVSDGVRETLMGLRALGVGIALDDFGTGYANFSRLRELPFDVVKIDRSFLEDAGTDSHVMELLTPLIAFARAFAPKIVMEGVENAGQLALVEALGSDWVQGFYLSKPMPPEALRKLIGSRRTAEAVAVH